MAGGTLLPILMPSNPWLIHTGANVLDMIARRAVSTILGEPCDAPMLSHDDRIFEIPPLSDDDMEKDFIPVPMPKMGIVSRVKQAGLQAYVALCALPLNTNHRYGAEGHNH